MVWFSWEGLKVGVRVMFWWCFGDVRFLFKIGYFLDVIKGDGILLDFENELVMRFDEGSGLFLIWC